MAIRVYDSLRRDIVPLTPRHEGRVSMYVCGPTVYGYIHIGNARTMLWFDQIRKYLAYRGFDVTYVMNYTDVDDKIIERSRVEGLPPEAIASKYEKAFESAMAALGADPADILVRATQHIDDMIKAVEGLIEKGVAYEADGDVYFAVERFLGYGKLAHRALEEMRAGERVEPGEHKRNPLDFALWKAAKEGEPAWSSPWGPGRPGWHIECSVMSTKYLGMGFDIHGGGADLIFPHHENEIAQAEALEGSEPFVRHWLHAGMVQMGAEKMSKSLGNLVLAKDVVAAYPAEAVRYWALSGSYRTQVVFSEDALGDALQAYERWKTFYEAAAHLMGDEMPPARSVVRPVGAEPGGPVSEFIAAMDDDFNSAEAFATVHDVVRSGNALLAQAQAGDGGARSRLIDTLAAFQEMTGLFGFAFRVPEVESHVVARLVEYLLELREEARAQKAFDRADAIRARLGDVGITVEDTPAGTRWRFTGG